MEEIKIEQETKEEVIANADTSVEEGRNELCCSTESSAQPVQQIIYQTNNYYYVEDNSGAKALKQAIIGACLSLIKVPSVILSVLGLVNGIKSLKKGFNGKALAAIIISGYTLLSIAVRGVMNIVSTVLSYVYGGSAFGWIFKLISKGTAISTLFKF